MTNHAPMTSAYDCRFAVDRLFYIATLTSALGVLAFIYVALIMNFFGFDGKSRDVGLFFISSLTFAPLVAFYLQHHEKKQAQSTRLSNIEAQHIWLATIALTAFALLALTASFSATPAQAWDQGAKLIAAAIASINLILLLSLNFPQYWSRLQSSWLGVLWNTQIQIVGFGFALLVALTLMFWIPESANTTHPFISVFTEPKFNKSSTMLIVLSFIFAVMVIGFAIVLAAIENRLTSRGSKWLPRLELASLMSAIVLVVVMFFDFSLPAEALHFITNVGPAIQLRNGGTLMVDTFSQYGPGPIIVTLAGLNLGPDTLTTANVVVQIHNIAFYAVWLVCLYRLSPLKSPAMIVGVALIGIVLALWGLGYSNINFAPSILGFRYLLPLLMVLAISCLPTTARNSIWTAATAFLATLWSIEAFFGAIGIQLAFIGMLGLHDRAWRRMFYDWSIALLPALVAIAAMATYTLLRADMFPDYGTYLSYLSIYNLLSPDWSLTANSKFFGWSALLLIVYLGLAEAWHRIFNPASSINPVQSSTLYYKVTPMLLLSLLMSLYFVGRSVEYTLILALLPAAAVAVSALLFLIPILLAQKRGKELIFFGFPVAIFIISLSFSINALSRTNAPYSFYLQECRDHGRCSPGALADAFTKRLNLRSVLEKAGNGFIDSYYDTSGTVRETVEILERLQPDQSKATVLIGPVRNIRLIGKVRDQIASDFALLYSGKWHSWPRSTTFTDELLPSRIKQILGAPIPLKDGDLVVVRKHEALLGAIEAGILQKIRDKFILCPVPGDTSEVIAYRVYRKTTCF